MNSEKGLCSSVHSVSSESQFGGGANLKKNLRTKWHCKNAWDLKVRYICTLCESLTIVGNIADAN
jgi:hypothetical protein